MAERRWVEEKAAWDNTRRLEKGAEVARLGPNKLPIQRSFLEWWNIRPSRATGGGAGGTPESQAAVECPRGFLPS